MICTCPSCQAVRAGEFELEYESLEGGEMSEQEELELAMELLSVQNEYEMEQFLGKLVRGIGRGLKAVRKVALPALKSLAKVALPIAGSALGSFIPIPGVGTMIGGAIGRAAANALELEFAGMDPGQADIEKARRIVRTLRSAINELSATLGSGPPETVVRSPRSWPNNSLPINSGESVVQSTTTSLGLWGRWSSMCRTSAIRSLPVPVSPTMRRLPEEKLAISTSFRISVRQTRQSPTSKPRIDVSSARRSISAQRSTRAAICSASVPLSTRSRTSATPTRSNCHFVSGEILCSETPTTTTRNDLDSFSILVTTVGSTSETTATQQSPS